VRGTRAESPSGKFVVYWMRTAVRGHENPALDVALSLANERGVPLLVYHAVSECYPYASDRHHTFILEGARDVARELRHRGIPYALHVERPSHRGPHLRDLAQRAVAVVTEDFPLDPLRAWTMALAEHAHVAAVDTACVVPTRLVGQAYDRAFAFTRATKALRAARVGAPWVDVEPAFPMAAPELPFASVDAETMDLPALIASTDIDHSVGPVPHTRGGSIAGYARFAAFVEGALDPYHRRRNDPLTEGPAAVSRMSAYLHYGHVSPMRLARMAIARGGAGAEKFLDELLTWRELAYAFCTLTPAVDTLAALPAWAQASLEAHREDPRAWIPSWETLARGQTGDRLWDAAQTSLQVHGELHNNVRMTWGKALLDWTRDPASALAMLIDLNHRYALDGRDPASFGGILWCLGQFDRPFLPERPILGAIRSRRTREHAARLNVPAYAAQCKTRAPERPFRVIVVGAGLSGLVCARTLADQGFSVTVIDKGRRPGGRATSRHDGDLVFDHGAQFFTARREWLERHVASWETDGVIARWTPRIVQTNVARPRDLATWWVGTPTMGAIAAHLAKGLDEQVQLATKVSRIWRSDDGTWRVECTGPDDAPGPALSADAVVLAMPAAQTAALLDGVHSKFAAAAASVSQTPCWAVMTTLRAVGNLGGDVFEDGQGAIMWAAREASKPGRKGAVARSAAGEEQWMLHASAAWTGEHLEHTPEAVGQMLTELFLKQRGAPPGSAIQVRAHRWRYARGHVAEAKGALFDASARLAVCGDWVNGARVEGAITSGIAAAGRLLGVVVER